VVSIDPRTVAAFELEDLIARGQPLGELVAATYAQLQPPAQRCFLDALFFRTLGVPLHPRRRGTRAMTVTYRGLVLWRQAVCGHCGLASYVTVERAILRARADHTRRPL
jgi:hypothetical protein